MRNEATPGQRSDRALVPRGIERKHEVDHGETGSDEQSGLAACGKILHGFDCRAAPRIADETIADAGESAERFGFLVAAGKHQRQRLNRTPVVEFNGPAAVPTLRCEGRGDELFTLSFELPQHFGW